MCRIDTQNNLMPNGTTFHRVPPNLKKKKKEVVIIVKNTWMKNLGAQ